jgi:hypothetical protein
MKITGKTLMVNFETEVKLGSNDAVELTLVHQAYISKGKDGKLDIDLDLSADITDVKFLGIEIEPGYKEYKKFKEQLKDLGIDLNKLVNEKEKELIDDGLEEKLKLMFKDKI